MHYINYKPRSMSVFILFATQLNIYDHAIRRRSRSIGMMNVCNFISSAQNFCDKIRKSSGGTAGNPSPSSSVEAFVKRDSIGYTNDIT